MDNGAFERFPARLPFEREQALHVRVFTLNGMLSKVSKARSSWVHTLSRTVAFRACLLGVGFAVLKVLSAQLVYPPQQNALLWLPAGLSLAVLLRAEKRRWPAYLAAIFVTEAMTVWAFGDPWGVALAWAVGNCLRTWVSAGLMRAWAGRWSQFTRIREVAVFVLAGGLLGPLPSATLGVGAAALAYGTPSFWADWLIWYLSDGLGALLVAPLLLSWTRQGQVRMGRLQVAELGLTLGVLVLLANTIFGSRATEGLVLSLPYVTLPLVLWAALRLGPRGASSAAVVLGALAVSGSTLGLGPFGEQVTDIHERMLSVQSFVAVVGLSSLMLAAVACERQRAHRTQRVLAEAGAVLAESLDWRDTLPRLARLLVPELASGFALWLTNAEGRLERVVQVGLDAAQERQLRDGLLRMTSRTWHIRGPEGSSVLVRLRRHGQLLGGLVLARSERERPLGVRDVLFAEDLARRCTVAVENARLFQQSREAIHARDEFIAITAHELRTPLTSLKLQLQSLGRVLQRTPEPAEGLEKLRRLTKQTTRLTWLVESLLDVGHIHTGRLRLERERVALGELVNEVTERLSEELERAGCALRVDVEPHVEGWWDRARVAQALTNLLGNAMKFGAGRPIEVSLTRRGEWARLEVKDRGIGVAPEALERIFGRFERAVSSREYGGLGLGLYMTRQIAEAHGGSIRVASVPGGGATFTLELPLGPRASAHAPEPPAHHA